MIPENDCAYICAADFLPWDALRGKAILITGATGLIGRTLTAALLYADKTRKLDLSVLALVRDKTRAGEIFSEHLESKSPLYLLEGTVERLPDIEGPVDYILHGAAQTESSAFVRQPVETAKTAVLGTLQLLELARQKHTAGFVYLSSMEVYGHPARGHRVKETDECALRPGEVRSSYPVSKLQGENLCCAYASEYGVPARIIRLTQTFGPGVRPEDPRIFAEFGRCARDGRDIVLHTRGRTERSYLYTADAATAILTVLLKGKNGQAYNAADGRTYCSVAQMAQKVAAAYGIGVRFQPEDGQKYGYGSLLYMDLDTSRLQALGWSAGSCKGGDPLLYLYERMMRDGFGGGKSADRKKILLVFPFPILRAGIQMFLLELVRSLSGEKYSFTLYCTGVADAALEGEFKAAGAKIVADGPLISGLGGQKDRSLFFRYLYKLCREEKFDIAHIHTSNLRVQAESLLTARCAGIKCRIAHSHFAPQEEGHFRTAFFRTLIQSCATGIAACSGWAAAYMCGAKHADRAMIFTNCINTEYFAFSAKQRAGCRERLGLTDALVLGHVGSFVDYKNHVFLIEVFYAVCRKNQRARLLLVGEGDRLDQIKDMAAACGLSDKVFFIGASDKVNEYLCAMDLFVLPSLAEGLPFVSLEAQASGLRCLVSDRVPPEAKIREDFTFFPLELGAEAWADKLLSMRPEKDEGRRNAWQAVRDAGRDIREVSRYAKDLYAAGCR